VVLVQIDLVFLRLRFFLLSDRLIKKVMLYTPLEQFAISSIIPIHFGNLYLSFTNSSLYVLLTVGIVSLWFYMATENGGFLVPSRYQSLVEMIYEFGVSLVDEQIGKEGRKYFPIILTIFVLILFMNLIGMIPYSFTPTSHLVVTFGLSLSIFIGVTIVGFLYHGFHFFSFLLPKGAPLPLAPLLVVLELVSYLFRAVSLGVRLFANMMAGHTLVKILSGFSWTMLSLGGVLAVASIVPFGVVFALIGLEIGVAVLQAYVFTILTCIYLNDAINLH
jgi:F-type H+-transporting ATPase subunit a